MLLVRHGETDAVGRILSGRAPGVHLNAAGRLEAHATAERLRHVALAAVLSSPRERAVETATVIAAPHELPVCVDAGLDEMDAGEWTGRSFAELDRDPRWNRYNTSRAAATVPGGESPARLQLRAVAALIDISRRYGAATVVAVTHAEVIRAAMLWVAGTSLDAWDRIEAATGSISEVVME